MAIWIKQNGTEIELNERPETEAKAKELGWKLKSEVEKQEKPRRTRRDAE